MRALHAVLFIVHIAIYCTIVRADALSVDTLFEVDFSTDDNGGCRTIGRQRLQSMLNEAETLARIGKQLVGDYSSSAEAKRLLDVLVKGNTDSDRSTLERHYETVRRFLTGPGRKPYLFCSDNWLEKRSINDNALDDDGNEFLDLKTGLPAKMKDVDRYMEVRKQSRGQTPYFSRLHMSIIFDYSYRPGGYCSVRGHKAVFSELLTPHTLTLCPSVFTDTRTLADITITPLASTRISSRDPSQIPTDAQRLSSVLPASTTLFHELFHLVLGNDNSYPNTGHEIYEPIRMSKMSVANALRNPETFAAMAVAYYYTVNKPVVDGNRVEFYAFFATRA